MAVARPVGRDSNTFLAINFWQLLINGYRKCVDLWKAIVRQAALQGSRPEHAQYHRDLPRMVNRVFHDAVKQSFVRIVTPRNLFRQILNGKIPNLLFEELATLAPAGDEFVPGNRRLGPILFGLPTRQRITV